MVHRSHLVSLCTAMIALSQTVLGMCSEITLTTAEEAEIYFYDAMQKVQTLADKITYLSLEERTFENTMNACNQLDDRISEISSTLSSIESSTLLMDWHAFTDLTVFKNQDLCNALIAYANNPSDKEALNPYQQYAIDLFLQSAYQDSSQTGKYLSGLAETKSSNSEQLTILNLSQKEGAPTDNLAEKILDTDADVVCVQDISDATNYDLYSALKHHYAHFYTVKGAHNLLIASKYSMENPEYIPLADSGYVHLALKSGQTLLGHVYAAFSEPNRDKLGSLEQILFAMESQYQENVPFMLCGSWKSDDANELLGTYFVFEANSNTLLLKPGSSRDREYQIETSEVYLSERHRGSLSLIKQPSHVTHDYSRLTHYRSEVAQRNENYIILCEANEGNDNNRNEAESKDGNDRAGSDERARLDITFGGGNDGKGNERVYGGIGITAPNGVDMSINGSVSKDANGNVSRQLEGKVSIPIGGR